MKFETIKEAFNFYRSQSVEQLETRAQELKAIIETDPAVDINSMNIELTAIKQAKDNAEEKAPAEARSQALSLISGMNTTSTPVDSEDAVSTKEYRNAFFKTLQGKDLTGAEKRAFNAVMEKRANAFNQTSNSGAVLPTQTLNEIISKAKTEGGLLAECRAFAMPCNISIPIGTPATKASRHTEGATVETESMTTASVSFAGYEIMKVLSISAKVRTMSIDAFEAYLVDSLKDSVIECMANEVVNGTGTNEGRGLETIDYVEGTNLKSVNLTSGKPAYTDFTGFVGMLKRGYVKGAKIALNNATLYERVYGCTDDTGRPIFIADPKNESVGKILGFDVVVDDNIADDTVYMGNFSKYYGYNLADGIAIEVSTQSSFTKGLIDFRALAVEDQKPLVDEAFIKMVFSLTA